MDRLKAVIRVKLRLMLRQGRGPWGVVGLALMLLGFIAPFAASLAVFTYVGLRVLDHQGDSELLHLILGGVWVFWTVFPIVGFSLNQSSDLTRLFIYPISKRTIFLANLLACFLDPTLLLVVPMFGVVLCCCSVGAMGTVVVMIALLLFLAQTIALSQAVLWGLLNILRSRRIRDWALLLVPILGLVVYLSPQLWLQRAIGTEVFETVIAWRPSRYFGPTPAGMAAQAIVAAKHGAGGTAALYLLGAAGYLLVTIAAGGWILNRLYVAEIGSHPTSARASRPTGGVGLERFASTPFLALALKEFRYYWRDPRHKAMFIAPLFPVAFVLASAVTTRSWGPTGAIVFTASVCLMGFTSLFQNAFGVDREGLRLLFLTPCPREDILIGKNLPAVGVSVLTTAAVVLAVGWILGDIRLAVLCACFGFPMALIMATVGNVISIHFPVRLARRGENPFTAPSGAGCLTALANLTGMIAVGAIGLPVLLAAVLPFILDRPLAYGLALPIAIIYALGIYVLSLRLYSAPALERNETKIVEECLTGEGR